MKSLYFERLTKGDGFLKAIGMEVPEIMNVCNTQIIQDIENCGKSATAIGICGHLKGDRPSART